MHKIVLHRFEKKVMVQQIINEEVDFCFQFCYVLTTVNFRRHNR